MKCTLKWVYYINPLLFVKLLDIFISIIIGPIFLNILLLKNYRQLRIYCNISKVTFKNYTASFILCLIYIYNWPRVVLRCMEYFQKNKIINMCNVNKSFCVLRFRDTKFQLVYANQYNESLKMILESFSNLVINIILLV